MVIQVGDTVRRVRGWWYGMKPGDTDVVTEVTPDGYLILRGHRGSGAIPAGHQSTNFEIVRRGEAPPAESDPTGKDPHQPGAKLDAGKVEMGLILNGMPRALLQVARVATYGANKYTRDGWLSVPDGPRRYTDAMYRHLNAEARGELHDSDTQLEHAAHAAWNALARLELLLRGQGTA